MIFDPSSTPHLKPWLVRTLEPICDAEPGALADYILALLKHNVPEPEMRNELAVQLDEFLEKECSSFIDTLFTVLRTKSYLPYSAASPSSPSFGPKTQDIGIPIPLDGLLSPSISTSPDRRPKRSIENDERDGRPPAKGPRLSSEGQFSRYSSGHGGRGESRSTGGWGSRIERPPATGYRDSVDMYGNATAMAGGMMMSGMNGSMGPMNGRRPQVYQPPDQKRGICRDYHNNGYCARGAMCKYSHGEDAVVPGLYPMNPAMQMPFMSMFGANPFGMAGVGAAYDPHEARMDMRPAAGRTQRAPLLPRIQQEDGSQVVHSSRASGELPVIQDLTPIAADGDAQPTTTPQVTPPQSVTSPELQRLPMRPDGYDRNGYSAMNGHSVSMNAPMDVDMGPSQPERQQNSHPRPTRGGARGRGGTFGGESHSFRPERRNDKTLVVEKIPEDKLTLEHVNEWFKRFGTVTNVAIDRSNAKALISFSNHDEAYAAWKSEDAVFNNRFVKLFWHRPMEGHGQVGSRMLAASAPLVANITTKETPLRPIPTSSKSTPARKLPGTPSAAASALAAKQQLLEQQIAEQKALMASLDTASSEDKKTLMARLRKLGEEMTSTPEPSTVMPTKKSDTSNVGGDDRERKERERLDKELEMHNASVAVEGEDSTEDLKAKLERLKAEAARLGISEPPADTSYGGAYRPYRGRARGGRGYRGAMRGGPPPRASMKLDNRPKKLLVKGVPREGLQALRDWFETTGQLESVETLDSGDIIVSFKSRAAAEQGLAKGNNVPTVGAVQVTWHTGKPAGKISDTKITASGPVDTGAADVDTITNARPQSPHPVIVHSPHVPEEEVVTSGWGEDGDGEDGMGML
ncbi:hypothetical protein Hypma_015287 [Hypsizygus marmoreus]|uniref:RNA-binding protein 26 n=1 Tax=Hypsizygus marmoreus TaxID=39966 RepID=A0A369K1M2_HYPMA|nr:hypothetical protein Hypma_015287 [Hypsizygus marmoreus]